MEVLNGLCAMLTPKMPSGVIPEVNQSNDKTCNQGSILALKPSQDFSRSPKQDCMKKIYVLQELEKTSYMLSQLVHQIFLYRTTFKYMICILNGIAILPSNNIFLTVTCLVPTLKNGMAQFDRSAVNDRYPENTTAIFTCNDGYILKGHNKSFCQAGSWTWNPYVPICYKDIGKDTDR